MSKPVRILQVVGCMNRAGVETWLMHVLRNIDRSRFQMDFLVHTNQPCAYDDEIRSLGARIIPCLNPSRPLQYARNFKRILHENGPYDVVHSHLHHYSGFTLWLAHQAGVPMRIAHSHNDTLAVEAKARIPRRVYLALSEYLIRTHATVGLACSRKAAYDLYGPDWQKDPRWGVLYYVIDLTPFSVPIDRIEVRRELGIPEDAFVIGHVGRFVKQKNHAFLIEIAAEVIKREPKTYLLLVGEGRLRSNIERQVAEMGLSERVIFAGVRSDVSRLMLGAMDVFVFPSLNEGLGLVLVEAQTAGLPLVISEVIPDEADIVSRAICRLTLKLSASAWAEAVLAHRKGILTEQQVDALNIVKKSPFNILEHIKLLEKFYFEQSSQHQ